ncbi:MAG: GspE/PulE family protein [Calditrichia bacterium]
MQDSMYKLGVSLVQQNIVEFETLKEALRIKQEEETTTRRGLAQILVTDFNVEENSVYEEIAKFYGFKVLDLPEEVDERIVEFIRNVIKALPENIDAMMREQRILIYKYDKNVSVRWLFVSVDPTNRHINEIARAIGAKRYEVRYISPVDYERLTEIVYVPENEFLRSIEDSEFEIEAEDPDAIIDEEAIDSEINRGLLVNLVEGMLVEAVRQGASDIHVIPADRTTTRIEFRIDGTLRPWHIQKGVRPEALSAVIKDRSKNIDRFEREMPQDGFIQRTVDNHIIRYRVSVLPIVGREYRYKLESIVIRILDDRKVITDFSKLGFQGGAMEDFKRAISQPQGMVIVTGPTGSGKSTTLIAALSYILRPEINVLTVEDPVEYVIQGVRQVKIGGKTDFERALRSILRHDPDVVMVGEIRDKETAETGIKLANTGHLTFSTLHTNDAPSAISRLFKIGVETFLIAYAINIIIAQRLMRRLCETCKRPYKQVDPAILLRLGFTDEEIETTTFYGAVGCKECHGGYKGRVAIHEALYFSREIRKMIFESNDDINEEMIRKQAVENGMLTLRAAGRERVKNGTTTLQELAAVTSDE